MDDRMIYLILILISVISAQNECGSSLKPDKLAVVGIWSRKFDNSTAQYRISDEDLSVRGYERTDSDKASSIIMLARHPEGCVVSNCGVRLTSLMQKNGAILHTDHNMVKPSDTTMDNIEDEFYCAKRNNSCGADVPIYRLVKHSINGPHYGYTFDNNGHSLPGYEKEYFPLCFGWRQTPSVVLFNSSADGICITLPNVDNGKIDYSNNQLNIYSIGTTATLQCNHGTAGVGLSNLLCTKDGWYPKIGLGKCVEQQKTQMIALIGSQQSDGPVDNSSCEIPKSIPNGNIVYSANVAKSTSLSTVPTSTRATVLCNIGHVPTTTTTTSRCIGSVWQPSLPSCVSLFDIKCPILSEPTNGELVFVNNSTSKPYTLDSEITLKCDKNYFGLGNITSKCTTTGWDKKIGECQPVGIRTLVDKQQRHKRQTSTGVACSVIATPANGNILYLQTNPSIQYSSGTSAYLMCNPLMTLSGSVSSMCQNGVWTPTIGSCNSALNIGSSVATCLDFPTPINGTITYSSGIGSHPSASTATLTCNLGSTVSGTTMSTCSNGVWTPTTMGTCTNTGGIGGIGTGTGSCLNPTVINGMMTYNQGNTFDMTRPSGTTATVTCNIGYSISGTTQAICTAGTYQPTLGTCVLGSTGGSTGTLQCTSMIAPIYGSVTYSTGGTMGPFASGTVVTATCTNGGAITGSSTATCQNGMWSPAFLGTCSMIGGSTTGQCGALTLPSGATATYTPFSLSTTSYTSGTVATVTCNGNSLGTSTCTNGLWSPAITQTCNGGTGGTTCAAMTRPFGESVTYDGASSFLTTFNNGVVARVSCTNGTQIGQATCFSGTWTPAITASCSGTNTAVGTQCVGAIVPANSQITYSDGNVVLHSSGATATLSCLNAATLTGSSYSSCQNGVWTPTLGSCTSTGAGSTNPCYTPPLTPTGATITYSAGYFAPWTAGSTATMSCPSGQSASGTTITTCQNGAWTPALGTCGTGTGIGTGLGCTPLSALSGTIVNGQMTYTPSLTTNIPIGTMVNVVCFSGYNLQGTAIATCTSSGWSPSSVGSCVRVSALIPRTTNISSTCIPMETPTHATLSYSTPTTIGAYQSGTTVTLKCDTNYTQTSGNISIATCHNGIWSPPNLSNCQKAHRG